MKNSNVNVRIKESVKQEAEEILEKIGISRATAIDIYYRQIILNKGIPFSIKLPDKNINKEELKNIINKGYKEAKEGNVADLEDVFNELENEV